MTYYDWENILKSVWDNEFSKQELLKLKINIDTLPWRRLFGQSTNKAHYFFCDKCNHRHTLVPLGKHEFLAIDESNYCELKYKIFEEELRLYFFKKDTFLYDLQHSTFNLGGLKPGKIIPDCCWQLGLFLNEYKVFFVYRTEQQKLINVLYQMFDKYIDKDLVFIIIGRRSFSTEAINAIRWHNGHIAFVDEFLYLDARGVLRSSTPLQKFESLKILSQKTSKYEVENIRQKTVIALAQLDDEYKKSSPGIKKPPYPLGVLHSRNILHMTVKEIAGKYRCSTRKIAKILHWIPDSIKLAYRETACELKKNEPAHVEKYSYDENADFFHTENS